MDAHQMKVMLTLSADERRGLNTIAAILGLTPRAYVEIKTREALTRELEQLGLPLPHAEPGPIPGQLALPDKPARGARKPRTTGSATKKESAATRRTRK
jgi:hypothetical protein